MQQSQPVTATVNSASTPASAGSPSEEAPPKQVAQAMDRLGQAARIIADIRIGADRLLEALFIASQPHQSTKPLQLFQKEDASMRRHLQDLRSLGRQLEESGVLNESLRSRSNSWGLHMPLVCPDGAVVAYAWKRQLAGQAGASAVDRTRLALKAFTDQKRRFFPHLDDGLLNNETPSKKHCGSEEIMLDCKDKVSNISTLPDVLKRLEKEVPNLEISTFERLDWLKRASSLSSSQNENSLEHNFHGSNNLRPGSFGAGAADRIAVIELLFPSVFRAVVSLHPAGSMDPDAVAFFSPDEGGSYVHARGCSVHHVYRHITEYAATALQYFLGNQAETSLYCLLHWICSYQTLFTRSCRNVTTSANDVGKPSATVDLKLLGATLDSLECLYAYVTDAIPPLPCIQKVVVMTHGTDDVVLVVVEEMNRNVVRKKDCHCCKAAAFTSWASLPLTIMHGRVALTSVHQRR